MRASGGVRVGGVELRAGLTVAPILVSNGRGDQTVLVGGGASARVRLPISRALGVVVATGADAFANRTDYAVAPMTKLSTPWLAPWAATGVEVSW